MIVFVDVSEKSSYKIRQCQRYHIPLLQGDYVEECLSQNKLLPKEKFLVSGLSENDDFKKGKIVGMFLTMFIVILEINFLQYCINLGYTTSPQN